MSSRYEDVNRKLSNQQVPEEEEEVTTYGNKSQQVPNLPNRKVTTHAPALSSNPNPNSMSGIRANQPAPQHHLYQQPQHVYTNTNNQSSVISDTYDDDEYTQAPYQHPNHNNTVFNPAVSAEFNGYHDDPDYYADHNAFQQQMSEIEYAQQLQYQQQQIAGYPADMGLQRNMPVMYRPAEPNFNEYYVKTPGDMKPSQYSPDDQSVVSL